MKSVQHGRSTSDVEVTNVSQHGFWIFVGEREVYASFQDFPWFEDATIRQLTTVELPSPHHLYWPELDVDLAVDSLDHPARYPLVSRRRIAERDPGKGRGQGTRRRMTTAPMSASTGSDAGRA